MSEDTPISRQLFSIPNLMGYFRILLIPLIVWRYVTAETLTDYYAAAVFMGISGITDFLDGFVARKFNMITKLGKALDPVADKLTQGAVVVSLCFHFPVMAALAVLLIVKESFMGVMGIVMLRKGKMLNGAKWYGKAATAVLYVVMFVLVLMPDIPVGAANGLIAVSGVLLLFSFVSYIPVYRKMSRTP